MTLLHEAVDSKKFDTRVVEKNIGKGLVTMADFAKSTSQLPDDAENAEYVSIDSLMDEGSAKSTTENSSS